MKSHLEQKNIRSALDMHEFHKLMKYQKKKNSNKKTNHNMKASRSEKNTIE